MSGNISQMRIHIISALFPPEPVMTAMTASDVAVELTRRGHDVTVFAPFPNRPSGVVLPGYKRQLWHVEENNGYRIVRTWHSLSKRSNFVSRTLENITFGLSATLGLMMTKPPDIVYMNDSVDLLFRSYGFSMKKESIKILLDFGRLHRTLRLY